MTTMGGLVYDWEIRIKWRVKGIKAVEGGHALALWCESSQRDLHYHELGGHYQPAVGAELQLKKWPTTLWSRILRSNF